MIVTHRPSALPEMSLDFVLNYDLWDLQVDYDFSSTTSMVPTEKRMIERYSPSELTGKIIGCAMQVHCILGNGFIGQNKTCIAEREKRNGFQNDLAVGRKMGGGGRQ